MHTDNHRYTQIFFQTSADVGLSWPVVGPSRLFSNAICAYLWLSVCIFVKIFGRPYHRSCSGHGMVCRRDRMAMIR